MDKELLKILKDASEYFDDEDDCNCGRCLAFRAVRKYIQEKKEV